MATRTGIYNVSGQFIMLPPPYAGGLPAGQQAVVADTVAVVTAALGGAALIAGNLQVRSLPGSTSTTVHNNGIGMDRVLATAGRNGAGAVTMAQAKVGDAVVAVEDCVNGADLTSSFESIISVAGQIQQTSASNLSATKILIELTAKS